MHGIHRVADGSIWDSLNSCNEQSSTESAVSATTGRWISALARVARQCDNLTPNSKNQGSCKLVNEYGHIGGVLTAKTLVLAALSLMS